MRMNLQSIITDTLMYTDDIVLLTDSSNKMQTLLNIWIVETTVKDGNKN